MISSFANEPLGKSEGDKESPSRSIKQFSELFKFRKLDGSGAKRLFRHAEPRHPSDGGAFLRRARYETVFGRDFSKKDRGLKFLRKDRWKYEAIKF